MVETSILIDAGCQGLNPQINGKHALILVPLFCDLMDKGGVVVPCRIPGYRYLFIASWRLFRQPCYYIRKPLVLAFPSCGQDHFVAFHFDIHGWIAEREEAMARSHSGKPWLFSVLHPPKEGPHRGVQAKVDFVQQFPIDKAQLRVM